MGEISYEVAAFIRNPIPELLELEYSQAHYIVSNRVQFFSKELNLDKTRLQQWCFVQAVLGWVWGLEDGIDPSYFMKLTKFFDEIDFY